MQSPGDIYEDFPVAAACPRHPFSAHCTLIQLVTIEPGMTTDSLQCELSQDCVPWGYPFLQDSDDEHVQTKYEALSYVWGDASSTSPISSNGCTFQVTLNLKAALQHLRLEIAPRTLWIDAMCINQAGVEERTQQVQAMTMVYQTAQRVVVWPGESSDGRDEAIDHLRKKSLELRSQHQLEDEHDLPLSLETWFTPQEIALLKRPWWTRIWVVQEVAVAQDVLVQCGKDTISWETLS